MVEWLVRNFSINSSKKTNEFPHLLKGFLLKKLSLTQIYDPILFERNFLLQKKATQHFIMNDGPLWQKMNHNNNCGIVIEQD